LIEQAVIRRDRVPTGNRGQTSAPVDLFRTRDGWVLCQVIGQPLFRRWAALMGEPRWLTDPRFKDDISRGDNGAIISERMAAGAPSAPAPRCWRFSGRRRFRRVRCSSRSRRWKIRR
jgi:crotonobetainyl-CoA:carnitine CoA-transferase CaiB-like acyl-CoA transferase